MYYNVLPAIREKGCSLCFSLFHFQSFFCLKRQTQTWRFAIPNSISRFHPRNHGRLHKCRFDIIALSMPNLAICRRRESLRNPIVIYINCETVFVLLDTASLHASRRNMLSSCFFSETFRRLIPKKLHVLGYPGPSSKKFTCKDGEWCRLKGTVW